MKVTDDDVGRKIRCPACSYATAVPPIKLNAKTYHFEYSVCDSLNSASSTGKNAAGIHGAAEPAGQSLGGVTLGPGASGGLTHPPAPPISGRQTLAQEVPEPPPSHTLPLRPGAKIAPVPKDTARYQAAIARSRARTASLRLRPAMQIPVAPPSQPIEAPAPVPVAVQPPPPPASVAAAQPATAKPRAISTPVAPPKPAQPQLLKPTPVPAKPAPQAAPAATIIPVGRLAPTPTDPLRYEAALQRSRALTASLRQQDASNDENLDFTSDSTQPSDTSQETPQDTSDAHQRPDRPESPILHRPESPVAARPDSPVAARPQTPVAADPEPSDASDRPDRPDAPPIRRPDAPTAIRRTLTTHVPRPGMPRPMIVKEPAPEANFVETPDTTPLPTSGRVDPAAQALEQMVRQVPSSSPSSPAPSAQPQHTPDQPSGYHGTHDPAEALRQLALAASGPSPAQDDLLQGLSQGLGQNLSHDLGQDIGEDDADALTGLARHVTPDTRKPANKPTAKPPTPTPSGPRAPLPADQERYNAALAPSRDKTRQTSGNS